MKEGNEYAWVVLCTVESTHLDILKCLSTVYQHIQNSWMWWVSNIMCAVKLSVLLIRGDHM